MITDAIFSNAHEGQVAELRHIAEKIGAKRCSIEIKEVKKKFSKTEKKVSMEEKKNITARGSEGYEQSCENLSHNSQKGVINAEFEGSYTPEMPELKWFAHSDALKGVIDSRLAGKNSSSCIILYGMAYKNNSRNRYKR